MVIINSTCPNQTGLPHPNLNANDKHFPNDLALSTVFSILQAESFPIMPCSSIYLYVHIPIKVFLFYWNSELPFKLISLSIPLPKDTGLYLCSHEFFFKCVLSDIIQLVYCYQTNSLEALYVLDYSVSQEHINDLLLVSKEC